MEYHTIKQMYNLVQNTTNINRLKHWKNTKVNAYKSESFFVSLYNIQCLSLS